MFVTRRHFIRTAAAAGLVIGTHNLMSRRSLADSAAPLYSFPLLGDLHYDRWEHHDLDWVKAKMAKDLTQIEGYVAVTRDHTPRLLDRVKHVIGESASPAPFVVQIGDFVEGLCGSYELQVRQFRDAIAAVDQVDFGAPTLITKGNHDITGPGASEAYDHVILPWLGGQLKQTLDNAAFVHRHEDDAVIFFDAYRPDLAWLEKTLAQPARHRFFVIHPPVVAYNARADWCVFGKQPDAERRQQIRELLGQHRVIVLSGHLHKYSVVARRTDRGAFAQVGVCSVIRQASPPITRELTGLDQYGPQLTDLEPNHSPASLTYRQQLLQEEKPHISFFEHAQVDGYAVVHVYTDRVELEVFVGTDDTRYRQHDLTKWVRQPASAGA